ncbi:hypothetical protein [Azospirillum sp. TSO35-2]|uniref:hypothetical protein n=1 Tax=Azospirillum sp. TSO35-2 TaxID=716796 RepID=UPI000D6148E5|nr:hypothetical protein [Azospirillum sp. TSO35-2]PWC35896.1 hypothetical protein TSO352_11780 [Azospirillum sp. TSO35-2]
MFKTKLAIAAVFAAALFPAVAFADDFEALCTGVDKSAETAKSCKCASEKITGADRVTVLDAMKALNAAMASGKAEDAAAATSKHAKGAELLMTAQATCM